MNDTLIRILLLAGSTIGIVWGALRRTPGVGILVTLILITLGVYLGPLSLSVIGLEWPENPAESILWSLGLGVAGAFGSLVLLEPGIERLTGQPHNLGIVDAVRGNVIVLLQWVALIWLTVAVLEEVVFRGFFISQIALLLGETAWARIIALILSSSLFGIGHAYQGRSGVFSTGAIGIFLGATYLASDFNLVMPILVHGIFDTIHLALIWAEVDARLRRLVFRSDRQRPD